MATFLPIEAVYSISVCARLTMIRMGMSITHLGTGSRGNATLLSSGSSHILVDQGFSGVQLEKRLKMLDVSPNDLEAIVITHHHGDHGGGALIAQKRWGVPVFANHRTTAELGLLPELTQQFEALDVLQFNQGISLLPVPVPHSGADNVAFVASHGGERSAIITDLGSWTDEVVHHVRGCQHIAVEANYDRKRLMVRTLSFDTERSHYRQGRAFVKRTNRRIPEPSLHRCNSKYHTNTSLRQDQCTALS